MRARILIPGAVAAAGVAAAMAAGPAFAGTGTGQLLVTPNTVKPGDTVTVNGTCPNNGGAFQGVTSPGFMGGMATMTAASTATKFTGTATIAPNMAGTITVMARCGMATLTVKVMVMNTMMRQTMMPTMMPTRMPMAMATAQRPMGMATTPMMGMGTTGMGTGTGMGMNNTMPSMNGSNQVAMTPMGAPDTGASSSSGFGTTGIALAAGGAVLAGGGATLMLRKRGRKSAARGQG